MNRRDDLMGRIVHNMLQAAEARQQEAARLVQLADAGEWDAICPPRREVCTGLRWDGQPCPIASCPWVDDRADYAQRTYLERVGFGPRYRRPSREKLFGKDRQWDAILEQAVSGIERFWDGCADALAEGRGFILCGTRGTGKTFALALTALVARQYTNSVRFVFAPRLYDALYARDPIADKLQYSKMLLLDDFGVEYASDWVMSRFQAFVEYRHANMLSTCITTNLSVADLSTLPGYERVISRWAESCGNDIYELPGRDLRRAHPAA